MKEKTDLELVGLVRQKNTAAFNELVLRYQEKLYWVARRVVGSHEEADDVVQDVFIRVYEGIGKFREESNFYTWLYRIAMNMSLNALQKKRIRTFVQFDEIMDQLFHSDDNTDKSLLRKEYQTLLDRSIDRLPAKQKAVFIMRYYDELSYQEMAKILHKSEGGLKANYFHALKKIQKYMQEEMK